MMKKTTSALAIAALLGTGAASAATFQISDDTTVGIGGAFYPAYTNTKNSSGNTESSYADYSRLIFSADKAAVDGTTASLYYQLRPQGALGTFADAGDTDTDETSAGVSTHVAYATLSGEFGSVTYGKNDNLFYRFVGVTQDYNDSIVFTRSNGEERTRVATYESPDFDGFGFAVESELSADGEQAKTDTGNSNSFNGAVYADLEPVQVHAAYSQGNLQNANSDGAYGLAAVTSIDVVDLKAVYTNSKINSDKLTTAGLFASTSYSFGSLHLGAQSVDLDGASNRTEVIGRATYDIADNVYTSVEYGSLDKANDEGNGFAVNLWYGF
ncbi:porin [Spiribacter roseus]|uniref:porin n=1 Tax=Spiribacter roseus TaxID=1855875 RepID=UPI00133017DB|nr:porin [Spiribacter roseus]